MFHTIDKVNINNNETIHELSAEFLMAQNPSSMPSSKLKLKVRALIILLWNLNPAVGLCNRM